MRTSTEFSLAAALLLTAVVAVFLASVRMGLMIDVRPDTWIMVAAAIGGLIVGLVVGTLIGLREPRPLPGVLLGVIAGATAGPAAGLLVVLPAAAVAALTGSVLLALFAVAMRRFSAGG